MPDHRRTPSEPVGARPVGAPARKRPAWLLPLLGLLVLVVILLLLLSRCGGDDDDSSSAAATTSPMSSPVTSTPATASAMSTTPAANSSSAISTGAGEAGGGSLMAGSDSLLPLSDAGQIGGDGDLSAYTGTTAEAKAVAVQSVPADEGFWVGSGDDDRVWVQLTGSADESPFKVRKGDSVSFTGKVVANTTGFGSGVTDAEGKKLLEAQGQHISVRRSALTLAQ